MKRLSAGGGFCGSPRWSDDTRTVVAYCLSAEDTIKARWSAVTDEGTTTLMAFDRDGGASREVAPEPGMKIAPHYLPDNDIGFIRKDRAANGIHYASGKVGPKGPIHYAAWSADATRPSRHSS